MIYKKMYYQLFNEVTDAIEKLKTAQQKCEELYISFEDDMEELACEAESEVEFKY